MDSFGAHDSASAQCVPGQALRHVYRREQRRCWQLAVAASALLVVAAPGCCTWSIAQAHGQVQVRGRAVRVAAQGGPETSIDVTDPNLERVLQLRSTSPTARLQWSLHVKEYTDGPQDPKAHNPEILETFLAHYDDNYRLTTVATSLVHLLENSKPMRSAFASYCTAKGVPQTFDVDRFDDAFLLDVFKYIQNGKAVVLGKEYPEAVASDQKHGKAVASGQNHGDGHAKPKAVGARPEKAKEGQKAPTRAELAAMVRECISRDEAVREAWTHYATTPEKHNIESLRGFLEQEQVSMLRAPAT